MSELEKLVDVPCDPMSRMFPRYQAITIGHSIVCDGYHPGKTTAVFSHFHEDHTHNIARTLTGCHRVIMSRTTFEALRGMKKIPDRGTFKILSEGEAFVTEFEEKIELLDANHVPGSRQVLVTMKENGDKILYSGDFCYPNMSVTKADVLVLEPDHGEEVHDFNTERSSVLRRIFGETLKAIENNMPVEICAHAGTMQDIMEQLEKGDDGECIPNMVPFFASEKDVGLTNAIKDTYNTKFRDIEAESKQLLNKHYNKKQSYVKFSRISSRPLDGRGITIHVDANKGFKNKGPFFMSDNRTYFACLASHSSFSNILKYVKEVEPKLVVIDGTRANPKTAECLKSSIKNTLGIHTITKNCCQ